MTTRKAKGERRIPVSVEGRLAFVQGNEHAMDVQIGLAHDLARQIADQAAQISPALAELAQFSEIGERLAHEDAELTTYLQARYADRKHVDHIVATLRIFRQRRALARLAAAQEALRLASELLAPDPIPGQLRELLEAQTDPGTEAIAGSPKLLDGQLDQAKTHFQAIQAALSVGNGWIEHQVARRERVRPNVMAFVRALNDWQHRKIQMPEEIRASVSPELAFILLRRMEIPKHLEDQVFHKVEVGRYLFYRWKEAGHAYAICLSDVSVEMPESFRVAGRLGLRRRKKDQ